MYDGTIIYQKECSMEPFPITPHVMKGRFLDEEAGDKDSEHRKCILILVRYAM